jgi:hypothetical protein
MALSKDMNSMAATSSKRLIYQWVTKISCGKITNPPKITTKITTKTILLSPNGELADKCWAMSQHVTNFVSHWWCLSGALNQVHGCPMSMSLSLSLALSLVLFPVLYKVQYSLLYTLG